MGKTNRSKKKVQTNVSAKLSLPTPTTDTIGQLNTKPQKKIQKKKKDKRREKKDKLKQKITQELQMKSTLAPDTTPVENLDHLLSKLQKSEQTFKAKSQRKITPGAKKQIEKTELVQFKNVLAHPAFQSDPMKAIKEHITNKVAIVAEQRHKKNVKKNQYKKQGKKMH
eukprot:TRINITY_DN2128_c0_g1_i1.p1 TRINITY_DN2128_c0_g1~~TRINITY_DN2128_c0_g1_i1.p1  ORF type:complete len:168 (-),score=37.56 TRINITY_DN2128_c0_g1_i1:25-528(-)